MTFEGHFSTVVTLCVQLMRDLLAIAKFLAVFTQFLLCVVLCEHVTCNDEHLSILYCVVCTISPRSVERLSMLYCVVCAIIPRSLQQTTAESPLQCQQLVS